MEYVEGFEGVFGGLIGLGKQKNSVPTENAERNFPQREPSPRFQSRDAVALHALKARFVRQSHASYAVGVLHYTIMISASRSTTESRL